MDVEGAPLLGAGVEVAAFHVEIARADRLGAQPVEQRHLGPRCDAHCGTNGTAWARRPTPGEGHDSPPPPGGRESGRTPNVRSAFFKDCFFLEGLEMTLILLLRKTPMSALLP